MQKSFILGLWVFLSSCLWGQTEAGQKIEAVFSVKLAAPDARGMGIRTSPGGTANITNMPLKELIVFSYGVQPYEVVGATGWMESERFDLIAKPERPLNNGELKMMIRSLLADRFGVVLHRENKEVPIYALVLAKPGGKLGPGLVETKSGSCTEPDRTKPMPRVEPGKPPEKYCGSFMMQRNGMTATGIPLDNFAGGLSRTLGRRVLDKTGLTGKFDIDLKFSPDESQPLKSGAEPPKAIEIDSPDPPLMTAIQEQLGLKLVSQKAPTEIIVIDKASRPEAN